MTKLTKTEQAILTQLETPQSWAGEPYKTTFVAASFERRNYAAACKLVDKGLAVIVEEPRDIRTYSGKPGYFLHHHQFAIQKKD